MSILESNNEFKLEMLNLETYKIYLSIKKIPMRNLRESDRYFEMLIKQKNEVGENLEIDLIFLKELSVKLHPKKPSIRRGYIKIQAESKDYFTVYLELRIPSRAIEKKNNLYGFIFEYSSKGMFEIKGECFFTEEVVVRLKQDYLKRQKEKAITPNVRNKGLQKDIYESVKKEKGITKTNSSAFKKCSNCHYYEKGKCGLYGIRVEKNEICRRFYSPKTKVYSGGAFSPK